MKLRLIILSITYVLSLKAQTYVPVPMQNCSWNMSFHAVCNWMTQIGDFYKTYSLYPLNDTIISSKRYIKFYASVTTNTTGAGCSNTHSVTQGYWGAVRQDTLNQKIYLIPKNQSAERLYYNFNLSKGDSLKTVEGLYPGFGWYRHVDSIEYRTYSDGICRRAFRLYPPANYIYMQMTYSYYDWMIEGIGFVTGFDETKKSVAHSGGNYYEYYQPTFIINSQTITTLPTNTCLTVMSVNEHTENEGIRIYPNPFNNILQVVGGLKQNSNHVEIFNLLGIQIISMELKENNNELDLSNLPNGIYFLKTGSVTKKIIKQ